MKKMIFVLGAASLLAACQDVTATSTSKAIPFIAEVPEGVTSIAAPGQNLTALRIDPVDGCYTFQHVGPVETTFLPLRANNGRPICTRAS
ncbi:lipoprotein [Planktotalea sp.]|uniref:lipoprotein n=1 Tax=Planktotalea sp. TaxID=2029877 RepID=UPI0025E4AE0F|nr:lipoprotein [Planktotalea sp.]